MPKIGRWFRDITISEKLDGTNGSIWVGLLPSAPEDSGPAGAVVEGPHELTGEPVLYVVRAGSRTRFVTPQDDNFGFARWVYDNAAALTALGVGTHFGEWWGRGIQRGYGQAGRTFSLFNVGRWANNIAGLQFDGQEMIPDVPQLSVVPVLYRGPLSAANGVDPIREAARRLTYSGSLAAPGFMDAEGVMVYHEALRTYGKYSLDGDGHKG